jgi:hypothetical protein
MEINIVEITIIVISVVAIILMIWVSKDDESDKSNHYSDKAYCPKCGYRIR